MLNTVFDIQRCMNEEYNRKSQEIDKFLGENQETEEDEEEIQETTPKIIPKPEKRKPFQPRYYSKIRINLGLHEIELTKLDGLCRKYGMSRSALISRFIQRARL
jgi:hypothetical protein